jgi:hypothetical protein
MLCRHHGCELEIRLHHTYRFFNRDYGVFDWGGVAHTEDKLNLGWVTADPTKDGDVKAPLQRKK